MLAMLVHRGPDDEGLHVDSRAALGARRLAIIDVAGGQQPISGEDGRVWAVQNGEIYNFSELRRELQSMGHRFRTEADTEVLPHAYEEWDLDFVTRLNGMFAFAIWDGPRARLVLGRDRFGEKPLLHAELPGGLLFASEIQALLAHPGVDRELDDDAIAAYLELGYVPAPLAAYRAIRKLPPAHLMVYEGGRSTLHRYWRLAFTPKWPIAAEEASREVSRLLDQAVRSRLMSEVPLGAFLSGGLDSSAVVASMCRVAPVVRTFSIGFTEEGYDETGYAREVARAFGTVHEDLVVGSMDVHVLPELIRHVGEPFADSSIIPTFHLARLTRPYVTVALTGDGGDELFGGYDRYRAALAADSLRVVPAVARRGAAALGAVLPDRSSVPRRVRRLRRFLTSAGTETDAMYARWTSYVRPDEWPGLVGERLRCRFPTRAFDPTLGAERFPASDVETYLPDDLLVKVDIASMATSLEARAPFLDHRLAEFVARLPRQEKYGRARSKIVLRRALKNVLPRRILSRDKRGFAIPIARWLSGPLRGAIRELLDDAPHSVAAGYLGPRGLAELVRVHASGSERAVAPLWSVLVLELWLREKSGNHVSLQMRQRG